MKPTPMTQMVRAAIGELAKRNALPATKAAIAAEIERCYRVKPADSTLRNCLTDSVGPGGFLATRGLLKAQNATLYDLAGPDDNKVPGRIEDDLIRWVTPAHGATLVSLTKARKIDGPASKAERYER